MVKPDHIKLIAHAIPPSYITQYPKFGAIATAIDTDEEMHQLWVCCNVMAIGRHKINDHGIGHIRLVVGYAIRMFALLTENGVVPSIAQDYGMSHEEALIVILLASCLHDVGHIVARQDHEITSLWLSADIVRRLLAPHYTISERVIIVSECLHAIHSHNYAAEVLTIEGGIVRLADALDIQKGRSSEAIKLGKVDIHAVSTNAIQSVSIQKGKEHPIHIDVEMTSSAGIFQLDTLLKRKLQGSGLLPHVSLYAKIVGENKSPITEYQINP